MAIFATEGQYSRFSALVKWLDAPEKPELFKDVVVMNDTAATLVLGTVLGKVTATGKYKRALQAAADGSQVPVAIYIGDAFGATADTALALNTDTKVLVLSRGKAIVAREALALDASFSTQTHKDFAYASLKAVGIMVEAAN
jgi:hypothetical protein